MITAKENYRRRLSGEKAEWIPLAGVRNADSKALMPRMNKDFIARHFVFDAEPPYEYGDNIYRSDWFDLDWEYVPAVGGSTVHPGAPKVPDISHWEDYVSVPTIDMFDFAECYEKNKEYFPPDCLSETVIMTGFWERLMSLMDVENAAVALIDEEQQEGVHRLFDQLSDFYCQYFTEMKKYFDLDMVQIHDDWGHQHSTFFSPDTAREMIGPYIKKVADCVHSQGMFFELHSCGKNETLVPVYIEMGVDLWAPQLMNDVYGLAQKYKGSGLFFGVHEHPDLPEDMPESEVIKAAHEWVEKYIDLDTVAFFMILPGMPGADKMELFKEEVKNYSAELLANR